MEKNPYPLWKKIQRVVDCLFGQNDCMETDRMVDCLFGQNDCMHSDKLTAPYNIYNNINNIKTENTTEITNQRIHTKTLSGERAVRAFPPSLEKFANILKMRISLFELVLCPRLNFIRQMEINVLKSKLEGLEGVMRG